MLFSFSLARQGTECCSKQICLQPVECDQRGACSMPSIAPQTNILWWGEREVSGWGRWSTPMKWCFEGSKPQTLFGTEPRTGRSWWKDECMFYRCLCWHKPPPRNAVNVTMMPCVVNVTMMPCVWVLFFFLSLKTHLIAGTVPDRCPSIYKDRSTSE